MTPTDMAKYAYDAVGNITAITRQAAATVAVVEFAPHGDVIGSTVTVYGTAFSPTPSQNTVKFNGTTATVTSSTTTQIVTTVPAGATSGTISVRVGNKTATSTAAFTVGNSGPIVVGTPNGTPMSTGDLFIAPLGFTAAQVGPTARVNPGASQTLTFSVAGKVGLLLVSVSAGQHLSFSFSGTLPSYYLTIRGPDGAPLYGPMCCSPTYAETGPVSITGTYTAVFDAGPTGTGTVTATAYAAPDQTTSVTPTSAGATVALTTTTPGQNMSFTFSGTCSSIPTPASSAASPHRLRGVPRQR